jgi:NADPH:quinone reductase-like Zn-dependent oxidoreductase
MRAVRLPEAGGPDHLVWEQIPTPVPGPGEALVRVHAAAITRDELEWPVDRLPAIPSYELSGVVAELGPGVEEVAVGEAVWALTPFDRDGVAAEYAVVPSALLAPKPVTLDHLEAAAIPLPALSAWQGLFEHGRLGEGQRVLIHGAAGAVGHCAVQLALDRGAHVVATASGERVTRARELGAGEVIDDASARFEDVLAPVDLVFDTVGGDRLARSAAVLRAGGRLVSVAEEPPEDSVATPGRRGIYFVVEPSREHLIELGTLVDRGVLSSVVDRGYALEDARAAFERSLAREKRGKVVLRVAQETSISEGRFS